MTGICMGCFTQAEQQEFYAATDISLKTIHITKRLILKLSYHEKNNLLWIGQSKHYPATPRVPVELVFCGSSSNAYSSRCFCYMELSCKKSGRYHLCSRRSATIRNRPAKLHRSEERRVGKECRSRW